MPDYGARDPVSNPIYVSSSIILRDYGACYPVSNPVYVSSSIIYSLDV